MQQQPLNKPIRRTVGALSRAFFVTGIYAAFGISWILLTDLFLAKTYNEVWDILYTSIAKGLLFVLLTSTLIFILVYIDFRQVLKESRLREDSEEALQEAQRIAHIGSFSYDIRTRKLEGTDEALRIIGLTRETFTGELEEVLSHMWREEGMRMFAECERAVRRHKAASMSGRVKDAEGLERDVSVRLLPIYDENDLPLRVVGTVQDVTEQKRAESSALESQSIYRTFINSSYDFVYMKDEKLRYIALNRHMAAYYGIPSERYAIGKRIVDFVPGKRAEELQERDDRVLETKEAFYVEETENGETFETISFPVPLANERIGVGGISRNITARHLAEIAVVQERDRAEMYLDVSPIIFIALDLEGRVSMINRAGCEMIGLSKSEITGVDWIARFVPEEERRETRRALTAFAKRGQTGFLAHENAIVTESGEQRIIEWKNVLLRDDSGTVTGVLGAGVDITESKKQFLQIQYLSDHDRLTGLYNRSFYETSKHAFDRAGRLPLTILLADINGLKLINDAFGYDAGDRIIAQTAELLRSCCGEGDLLARVGGDEFALILPGVSPADAYRVTVAIREAFEAYNEALTDKTMVITLSIGSGTKTSPEQDIMEVERNAEANMSRHKLFDQKSHHNAVLSSITATMYERSNETESHAERLLQLCVMTGESMGLSHEELDKLKLYSMLHDIGKIGISDQILKKPGKLTEEEWEEMRKHPEIGYRIAMSSPDFAHIAEYILTHHERWDGRGYPRGLSGESIPILSRILAVVDAYDAMTQDRVYHKAISHEEAMSEVIRNAGSQFDPHVVEVFAREMEKQMA